MIRRSPAHVYHGRWPLQMVRLINEKGHWDEIDAIDRRWWAWHNRQTFPPASL